MKKQRSIEAQILGVLKQNKCGRDASDVSREVGISKATLYSWQKKYSGIESSQIKQMKDLQERIAG
jgi:putative transposase